MLREKAMRKILMTTLCLFVFLIASILSSFKNDSETVISTVTLTDPVYQTVYLLDDEERLVRYQLEILDDSMEERVQQIFDSMRIDSSVSIPTFFHKFIPSDTTLLDFHVDGKTLILNLSSSLFTGSSYLEEVIVEALTYSVTSIPDIDGLTLQVEGMTVTALPQTKIMIPQVLTKGYGINKDFDFTSLFGITKVTTYYYETLDNMNYYVPVTKYINDDKDKIKIIIENLSSKYIHEANLSSYLSEATKLLDYRYSNDVMVLNFNEAIFDANQKILEEVVYSIAGSVFANYDASSVVFQVNGHDFLTKSKKDIEQSKKLVYNH